MMAWYEVGLREKTVWKALRPSLDEWGGWRVLVSLGHEVGESLGDEGEGRGECVWIGWKVEGKGGRGRRCTR